MKQVIEPKTIKVNVLNVIQVAVLCGVGFYFSKISASMFRSGCFCHFPPIKSSEGREPYIPEDLVQGHRSKLQESPSFAVEAFQEVISLGPESNGCVISDQRAIMIRLILPYFFHSP